MTCKCGGGFLAGLGNWIECTCQDVSNEVIDLNFRCPCCGGENTIEGVTRGEAASLTKATCSQCGRTSVFDM